jgi:hypothetical protein
MAAVNGAYDRIRRALAPVPELTDDANATNGAQRTRWSGPAGEVAAG